MIKISNGVQRILSAIILFPIAIIVIFLGNKFLFNLTIAIIGTMALIEYYKAITKICKPIKWGGYIVSSLIAISRFIPKDYLNILINLSFPMILLSYFIQAIVSNMKTNFKDIAYSFFGTAFITYSFWFLCQIYGLENGKYLIWYALIPSWGSDIFAYFIRKKFGKHKLTKVSPKKSIERSIAGIVASLILCLILGIVYNHFGIIHINYLYIGIVSIILCIIGQIGDLSASIIKRYVDIKDYSEIIPGHGGVLDRFDSTIFLAPFAFIFLKIMLIYL